MNNKPPLFSLSERAGIEPFYWDVYGGYHETSDEARRKFLSAMGYPTENDKQIAESLKEIEELPWQRLLEPVCVLRTMAEAPTRLAFTHIPLILTAEEKRGEISWSLELEDGRNLSGAVPAGELEVVEQRVIDDLPRFRVKLPLPEDLPQGYHRVSVRRGATRGEGTLIIAPSSAYNPEWLSEKHERIWGVACQLYALRSPTNWGMGDFSDLATLCGEIGEQGGDAVGLPPLHALFSTRPDLVSPYSPSSRLFLNPLYIDVTAVPDYENCLDAREAVESGDFASRLETARASDQVTHPEVAVLKRKILNQLFRYFEEAHPLGSNSPRRADFECFISEGGHRLQRYALFETLLEHFTPDTVESWPPAYRDPGSPEVREFAKQNQDRVRFHSYLQWEADRQLAKVANQCAANGMALGLYRDLAVGVAPGGADAWVDHGIFVEDTRFGAPPDPLGPAGQDWGMPPYHPVRLYESAFEPYIAMLRANMRHAGAVRIDHVMWLQHLFWIPSGGDASDGAYVVYPLDDLLAILALESHRNRCLVIGEDLGTVPDGFRERLAVEHVLSYRLLQFERYSNGMYKRPDAYPPLSLTSPASHDLPTLAGLWRETDIDILLEIGLIPTEEDAAERRRQRAQDRELLIAALADQELLSADFPNSPDVDEEKLTALIDAVHSFLARSPAALLMINLEDILASTQQVNVPGTVDEYPNWRLKLPFIVEHDSGVEGLAALAKTIMKERAPSSS